VTTFGLFLSSEELAPRALVETAVRAERAGFQTLWLSDHYHPWNDEQGQAPFVWSVLGAIAARTSTVRCFTAVTCPTVRIHPAVLAQATATTSLLFEGRFFFGVGSGEALNEHILGHRWPPADVRLAMLEEAVAVIRELWAGGTVDHHGSFYEVENARLFDPPAEPPPIIVSAFGPKSIEVAARIGDGYWGHAPDPDLLDRFDGAGGTGPRYAQLNLCWAEDVSVARKTVHDIWPNGAIPGQLAQDLPTWSHFEEAAGMVSEDDATASVPCGPDIGPVLESVRRFLDAGYDHLYFHQIGPDQDGFFGFWTDELQPALAELDTARRNQGDQ